jgi:hypothetical protein
MNQLKPKERHERLLANTDKEKIVQYLTSGQETDVTKISVTLARQCDLFVHFQRLWKMRVAGLDERLNTEEYMKNIYTNKRALYKELIKLASPQQSE